MGPQLNRMSKTDQSRISSRWGWRRRRDLLCK